MKRNIMSAKAVIIAVVCLIVFGAVVIGVQNKNPDNPPVAVTEPYKKAGKPLVKTGVPNPATDFRYVLTGAGGSEVSITGYIGTSSEVVIPDNINGVPVKRIASGAFGKDTKVKYVYIPATVTSIVKKAFLLSDELTEIEVSADNEIYSSLDGVLYNKNKTTLLTFPSGRGGIFLIPKTVTKIEDYAFYYCYELQKVNMYNNVTHIGDFAFSFCWNLRELRLSDNLITLGKEALSHNYDLTKIYLPKNITSIGEDALLGSQSSPGYYEYYFVDGIYCVKNSYAESYVKNLNLTPAPTDDLRHEPDSGIYISSNFLVGTNVYSNTVTSGAGFDTAKTFAEGNENYYGFTVYNLGAKLNGADAVLTDDAVIYIPAGKYPSMLKVFKIEAGELVAVSSQIVSPFSDGKKYIKFTSNSLGSFTVAEYFEITKGDADGDGRISVSDARLALRAAAELETLHPAQLLAADLDKSGTVSITEARKILRVAVNLESF